MVILFTLILGLISIVQFMISTQHNLNSPLMIHNNHNHNRHISAKVFDSLIDKAQNSTQHGDYQTAMKVFEQAFIFVNNITHFKLHNRYAKLSTDDMKNYTYVKNIVNTAMSISAVSNVSGNIDELAHFYHYMGVCQILLTNFNESRLMFEKSIKMNGSVAVQKANYFSLGQLLHLNFNELENATTMFENVLELDNARTIENMQACISIGTILLRSHHQFTLERSKQLFDKITKVLGHNFDLYIQFATMISQKYNARTYAREIVSKSLTLYTTGRDRANAIQYLAKMDDQNGNYTSAVTTSQGLY